MSLRISGSEGSPDLNVLVIAGMKKIPWYFLMVTYTPYQKLICPHRNPDMNVDSVNGLFVLKLILQIKNPHYPYIKIWGFCRRYPFWHLPDGCFCFRLVIIDKEMIVFLRWLIQVFFWNKYWKRSGREMVSKVSFSGCIGWTYEKPIFLMGVGYSFFDQ